MRLLRRVGIALLALIFGLTAHASGVSCRAVRANGTSLTVWETIWGDADVADWQRLPSCPVPTSSESVSFGAPTPDRLVDIKVVARRNVRIEDLT